MEKCQPPKLEDVGSNPASSVQIEKVAKIVCNSTTCRIEDCSHFWPHEKKKVEIEFCTTWQFCSSVGIRVKCEKVVDN